MHKKLYMYTDGGSRSNPGPAAIGIVVLDEKERILAEFNQFIGKATNNEAEYIAVIKGLALASNFCKGEIVVTLDSQLVASQLSGKYKIKEARLRRLFELAKEEEKKFEKVSYRHVRREHPFIKKADALVNEALDEVLKGTDD